MQAQNQRFFDFLMLSVGVLIGLLVGLVFFVSMNLLETSGDFAAEDPALRADIASRLEPVGRVVLLGAEELAAAAPAPARVATVLTGPQVYNEACFTCHAAPGIGGAPVLGDASAWSDRIAKGLDTLATNAINGFQGNTGVMPPKGGRLDLSDAEIRSAIEFMLEQVAAQ